MTIRFTAAAAAALLFATSTAAEALAALTVNLDCGSTDGRVMIAVFDSEAAYDGRGAPVRQLAAEPGQPIRIEGLKPGRYAIKSFHDVNGNGKMDANPFGIPTEPFAFSNNAVGNMGPARWADAAFEVGEGGAVQTLRLRQGG